MSSSAREADPPDTGPVDRRAWITGAALAARHIAARHVALAVLENELLEILDASDDALIDALRALRNRYRAARRLASHMPQSHVAATASLREAIELIDALIEALGLDAPGGVT